MSINIKNTNDPFYRYKRPISKISNKSGRTTIDNLKEIALCLKTKPHYILHYIKVTKSVPIVKSDIKAILTHGEIEELLNKFISEYIICSLCHDPEYVINKDGKNLCNNCNACGNSILIPKNKFTNIIYKDFTL
jgi:translation initiation factor 5